MTEDEEALFTAVINNDIEIADKLLKKGTNPNTITQQGITVLTSAIYHNQIEIVKLLIDHDVKAKIQLWSGIPMIIAAERNNTEIVKLLKEYVKLLKEYNNRKRKALILSNRN